MGRKTAHFLAIVLGAMAMVPRATAPANWADLRAQWEYSHAVNAVVTFAALCCSVMSQLTARE